MTTSGHAMATSGQTNYNFRFRPDLMVEPIESPKKFNMKKVTILDDEEANKSRKSRLKQQRKEDRDDHNDDSEDSGTDFIVFSVIQYESYRMSHTAYVFLAHASGEVTAGYLSRGYLSCGDLVSKACDG